MRLAFVLGTRPEIIKTAPLIFEAQARELPFLIVHTGQHYDWEMDRRFFEELGLPEPAVRLEAGGKPYAEQVAYLLRELSRVFGQERPDAVVVQGDTVTVMAAALAARGFNIPVVHHEACLRSRDPRMSEEYHRIITDHVSDLLFAPTEDALRNAREEGVPRDRAHLTGNTIVDAVKRFSEEAKARSTALEDLGLAPRSYFLLTFHRAENVDDPHRFASFLRAIERVRDENKDRPIVFPAHPRVEKRRAEFGLAWPEGVKIVPPLGYLDMLRLVAEADVVMTDSGGLQEEAALLGTPCVTLRDSTERPETVAAGVNVIAGLDPERIASAVASMRGKRFEPIAAFGDGRAAGRIIDLILERL